MKTTLPKSQNNFVSSIIGKSFLLIITILFCFSNDLLAGIKPVSKYERVSPGGYHGRNISSPFIKGNRNASAVAIKGLSLFNGPAVSYAGPQVYVAGTAITPLSPTSSGVDDAGYSTFTTTLGSGFNIPAGVAVDAAGNIYIGDQNNNVVKEILAGTNTPIVIGTGFSTPDGVAVDAYGNVFVADDGNNLVKEIPVGGGPIITIGSGFLQPFDVAVDSKGNVYVADRGNNAVKEIPVGGGATFAIGS